MSEPRPKRLLRVRVPVVTLAELLGFLVPVVVGALTATAPPLAAVPALVAAGAVLGAGQAGVLRRVLTRFPTRRWITGTGAAAAVAYLLGLLPALTPAPAVTAAIVVLPLLLSIGTAQWPAGLAVFLAVATPLWSAGQPLAVTILVGAGAGGLMAATVAVVTGIALRRFVTPLNPAPPAARLPM